jgi:hypothetical protein
VPQDMWREGEVEVKFKVRNRRFKVRGGWRVEKAKGTWCYT